MSRSNPNTRSANPSTRWFEWSGKEGVVTYYDKEAQEKRTVNLPFVFILLDETATVKGWHEPSESGIYANEVRDTRQEVLVVKAFKGGELASGHYAGIRDRVGRLGGHFVANLYVAYRHEDKTMNIGALQFKGAALKAWMDYRKASRKSVYEKAISISGFGEGKKGSVVYRFPKFTGMDIKPESNAEAIELDKKLQEYLAEYFARTKDAAAQISSEELAEASREVAESEGLSDAAIAQETSRQAAREDEFVDDEIPF